MTVTISLRRSLAAAILFLLSATLVGPAGQVFAQDAPLPEQATPANEGESLKKLIDEIRREEAEQAAAKKVAPPKNENRVMGMLDAAYLDFQRIGNSQARYLAVHLKFANPTGDEFKLRTEDITAEIDGEKREISDLPARIQSESVTHAGKNIPLLSKMQPPKDRTWLIPANGMKDIWVVYPDIPIGTSIPKCLLRIKLKEVTSEYDINEIQRSRLKMNVERIGPRKCLALVTIDGAFNVFNSASFVEELEKLAEQNVARVVVRWGKNAVQPETRVFDWLQMAMVGGPNPNQQSIFPSIPTSIREFHLTEFRASDESKSRKAAGLRPTGLHRLHKSATEAVTAALRTAYQALPREELLSEIRSGHPLTRAAALAYGGGRLEIDQLPLLFDWTEDANPDIQRAAVQALSQFGEPKAIQKLVAIAKQDANPLAPMAIEGLASSRFGTAHDALLELWNVEPVEAKRKIVLVLAKYPRPLWSETLYDYVVNSPSGMDSDSLRALVQIGHPKIVDALEKALASAHKQVRDQAFLELAKRNDDRSEALALNHALKMLETSPPDAVVIQLLTRTKDPRAIPLLVKQLDSSNDRATTIGLLMQIGDQSVLENLLPRYPNLSNGEKVQVLLGLKLFRHSQFRELCGDALASNDNQLVTTAAKALREEGSSESEKQLVAALNKQKAGYLLTNIMNALAEFATPSAREALIKMRESSDQSVRDAAKLALRSLLAKSPAYPYLHQALTIRQANRDNDIRKDKEAREVFDLAAQLDPMLPETFVERGKLLLRLEKFKDARKDLERAIELKYEPMDHDSGEFVTSLALARVGDGQVVEGIKFLDENKEKHTEVAASPEAKQIKSLFLYNAACAYSRAVEQCDKQTALPNREVLREKCRNQAILDLTQSFAEGFDDYDWTAKDPDFKVLREDAGFKAILANRPGGKKKTEPKDEDE